MPSAEFMAAYGAEPEEKKETRSAPGRDITPTRVRHFTGQDDAFALGSMDSLSWGFLDEFGGFMTAFGPSQKSRGIKTIWDSGLSFNDAWDHNSKVFREEMDLSEELNPNTYLAGQLAGGLVLIGSKVGGAVAATKGLTGTALKEARAANAKQMVRASAIFGAAYGVGSADGDFQDRLTGGLVGGATGAIGGYVVGVALTKWAPAGISRAGALFRRGKPIELTEALVPMTPKVINAVDGAADDALGLASKKAVAKVDPAGLDASVKLGAPAKVASVSDDLPEGALLTARELLGEPGAAKAALTKRIGKMSQIEAQRLFKSIAEDEVAGNVATPHYQSLLNIDITDTKLKADDIVRVAELFEDATEKLAAKAGLGSKTVVGMEQAVGKELKRGVTLADLEDAFEVGKKGFVKTRIAQHVMLTSTAKVIRLRAELVPKVLAGDTTAKAQLAEELTDAAHRFVLARGILSNAGRNLGILAHGTKARMVEVAEDIYEIESAAAIGKRVKDALGEMDDTAISALLNQVKTLDDGDRIMRVLLDPAEAKAYSVWARTANTVGGFLRSNALTPATGAFNTLGFIVNDFFRNDLAKGLAARTMLADGKLAEGMALQLEHRIGRSVYWAAHKSGLKSLLKRVQWEFWSDVERIPGVGWGSGKVLDKARLKRGTMLSEGYAPPELREFKTQARLAVDDVGRFQAENEAARAANGDGAFANLVFHANRARAVAANTLDSTGNAAMKLFTGAIDDWGREFTRYKQTHAEAARFGFREAIEAGVPPEDVAAYAEKRARELATLPTADLMARVEAALVASPDGLRGEAEFLAHVGKRVDDEASTVLFMDGPQSEFGKKSASFLSSADKLGLVFPYVRTPIRLFEHGVVNYGPFASRSREIQDILKRGAMATATPDEKMAAELTKARVEIGSTVFDIGLTMGLAGAVTATNGGFDNSAGLDNGPAQSIKFPGGYYLEYGRADPFAFTVGMGALVGQALRAGFASGTEYDQAEALKAGIATALMGVFDSVIGKSYLKSLSDSLELFNASSPEAVWESAKKIGGNAAARMIPMAGIGKQFNETLAGQVEAVTFMDQLLRHIPGAAFHMAPKVDVMGDPVKGRFMGIQMGNSETTDGEPISDVKRQLRDLGIPLNAIRKSDPDGFDLNSEELSEVRTVRGKEAVNDEGYTMEEALQELFSDPSFQSLPTKEQKRDMVTETIRSFNKPAWEILAERNPNFAAKRTYTRSFTDYMSPEGGSMNRRDAKAAALEDVEADGLPAPQF